MSNHHKRCKWQNYTAFEFLPCPYCRIEELTEQNAKLQYLVDHSGANILLQEEIKALKAGVEVSGTVSMAGTEPPLFKAFVPMHFQGLDVRAFVIPKEDV